MIGNISGSIIFIAMGVICIYVIIRQFFIIPNIPKSKRWQKVKAVTKGRKIYTEKNIPSHTRVQSPYRKEAVRIITYTVDGVTYEKTVPDEYDRLHIFYKKSNPNYFKAMYEIKQCRRENTVLYFIFLLFMAVAFIALGILCIADVISNL